MSSAPDTAMASTAHPKPVESDKEQDDLFRWQGLFEDIMDQDPPTQSQHNPPPHRLPTPPSQLPPPLLSPELLPVLEYVSPDVGSVPTDDIGASVWAQPYSEKEPRETGSSPRHPDPTPESRDIASSGRTRRLYVANHDSEDSDDERATIIVRRRHRQGPPNPYSQMWAESNAHSFEPSSESTSSLSDAPFSFNSFPARAPPQAISQAPSVPIYPYYNSSGNHSEMPSSFVGSSTSRTQLIGGKDSSTPPSNVPFSFNSILAQAPPQVTSQVPEISSSFRSGSSINQSDPSPSFASSSARTLPVEKVAARMAPASSSATSTSQSLIPFSSHTAHAGSQSPNARSRDYGARIPVIAPQKHESPSFKIGSAGQASHNPSSSSEERMGFFVGGNDQIIYKNLVKVLVARLSMGDNSSLRDNLQTYLKRVSQMSRVECLAESDRCLSELLQISTTLGISKRPEIRQALDEDEKLLADILSDLLNSKEEKEAVLSLTGEMAHSFLDLLQVVISKGFLDSHGTTPKARRLLVKLSLQADIVLPSQLISGLTMLNDGQAVNGGGNADIFRALHEGKEVAVKRIRMHLGKDSQKIRRGFSKEALVWQHLKHPNVLPFLGIDSEMFTSALCMVSPWMKHGTIMDFRAAIGPSNIGIKDRLIEVADGLRYLHDEGIVHGDLRGGNILVDDQWHAVLADFGLTTFGDSTMTAATFETNASGTTRWMAPELLFSEDDNPSGIKKTCASDVYAYGCVCLEVYTGRPPFADISNETVVICQLVQGKRPSVEFLRREAQIEVSEDILELVDQCWSKSPDERPLSADVVRVLTGTR